MPITKYNFSVDKIDMATRRILPETVLHGQTFMELLEECSDFIEKHDFKHLDSCIITNYKNKQGDPKIITFSNFVMKMSEHLFLASNCCAVDIEDFEL